MARSADGLHLRANQSTSLATWLKKVPAALIPSAICAVQRPLALPSGWCCPSRRARPPAASGAWDLASTLMTATSPLPCLSTPVRRCMHWSTGCGMRVTLLRMPILHYTCYSLSPVALVAPPDGYYFVCRPLPEHPRPELPYFDDARLRLANPHLRMGHQH